MGQTSVDASLDVFFRKEVDNRVNVPFVRHGGESPEAEAHVAQQRGPKPPPGNAGVQVVVDNRTIDDSLAAHAWVATKRAQHGHGQEGPSVYRHTLAVQDDGF